MSFKADGFRAVKCDECATELPECTGRMEAGVLILAAICERCGSIFELRE
jgi:hypothetical protein